MGMCSLGKADTNGALAHHIAFEVITSVHKRPVPDTVLGEEHGSGRDRHDENHDPNERTIADMVDPLPWRHARSPGGSLPPALHRYTPVLSSLSLSPNYLLFWCSGPASVYGLV